MRHSSILIVDDDATNYDVIETLLAGQDYLLHYAASGKEAIEFLSIYKPDVILLDVMMPEMDGIEVCKKIKSIPQWVAVPIIILTALSDKEDLARCLNAGADDFISKPVNRLELTSRVRSMLRIHEQYQQLASFNIILEETVEERTAQLQNMLYEDGLTQLPSRTFLRDKLEEFIQSGETNFALAYLDCDQFKLVNGSFGYAIGDELLLAITQRLRDQLKPGDVLARMGEDEFCFLLYNINDEASLIPHIQDILNSFAKAFTVADFEIFMSATIGIALGNTTYQQAEEPLQDADTAMYKAKTQNKGSYQIFDRQMSITMLGRLKLETDLQRALPQHELVTYYQPIVDLKTEKISGFEALLRWKHPERGMVSPDDFISCMEETGLIIPVGMFVFKQACQQLQRWHQQGWTELTMSINLSVKQFACPTLLADIDRVLAETSVRPASLKLEVTETTIMDNAQAAILLSEQLRARQIQISIDDFGTGYSSLSYLQKLPADIMKIDRSFISQMQAGNHDYQLASTIISLGNQLGFAIVAEGIETHSQLELLQELGCELGQGYLFSKPLAAEEIESRFLSHGAANPA